MPLPILELFKRMDGKEVSDIHLQVGSVPMFRIKGDIEQIEETARNISRGRQRNPFMNAKNECCPLRSQ